MSEVESWVQYNFPELMEYIKTYMRDNDEYTFEEAFESVDSVIYKLWWNAK